MPPARKSAETAAERYARRLEALRRQLAAEAEPQLAQFFADMAERVAHRAQAQNTASAHFLRLQRKAYPFTDDDLCPDAENRALLVLLLPLLISALESGWEAAAAEFGFATAFSVSEPFIAEVLRTVIPARAAQILNTTRTALSEALTTGAASGYTITQLVDGVAADKFAGIRALVAETYANRAETIARTETQYAANRGALALYRANGVQRVEMSDGTAFDKVCADRDGVIVGIDEGEAELASEHPNGFLELLPYRAN